MLTQKEYNQLWEDWFKKPLRGVTMPCYDDYVKFEHMWEAVVNMFGPGGIRYILVAEARPGSIHTPFVYDKSKQSRQYLTTMHNAIYREEGPTIKGTNKTDPAIMIHDLVRRGVLLIDLFPFAITYNRGMRNRLCQSGTIRAAWDGHGAPPAYLENMSQKINDLNAHGLLHRKWDLALIAPPIVSCCILSNGAAYPTISVPGNPGRHDVDFLTVNLNSNRCKCTCDGGSACNMKKVAIGGANYPTSTLITEAFR